VKNRVQWYAEIKVTNPEMSAAPFNQYSFLSAAFLWITVLLYSPDQIRVGKSLRNQLRRNAFLIRS
jgi:hypothetical protein